MLRPELPRIVEDIVTAVRLEVPEYARPLEGDFARVLHQGVAVALAQFVELLGRDAEVPDLAVYRGLGKAQLREGRTLDALQSAYRVGARVAWRATVTAGEQAGLAPEVLYRTAEAIFAYLERLAATSVAGYAQEQSLQAGAAQSHRRVLVEMLARWPVAAPADVERAAAQAGWSLPATLAAVAVGSAEAAAVARRLPTGTIGADLEPVAVLLVPDPDGPGRSGQLVAGIGRLRAVLGPTVGWAQAHQSVRRAVAAWPLHAAQALGDLPLVRADDYLLTLLLTVDPALTRDVVRLRLAPLDELPAGARSRAVATLRAWLDAHGDAAVTAAVLEVHPQTVRYRLSGLREIFGPLLDDPVTRLELALALRADALSTAQAAAG